MSLKILFVLHCCGNNGHQIVWSATPQINHFYFILLSLLPYFQLFSRIIAPRVFDHTSFDNVTPFNSEFVFTRT